MARRCLILLLLLCQISQPLSAQGNPVITSGPPQGKVAPTIPSLPSAPPSLSPPTVTDYFHCERGYSLRGKKFQCDSYGKADAEKFRLAIETTPEAAHEIALYQLHQTHSRTIAYVVSAGIFTIIVGALAAAALRRAAPHGAQVIRDTTFLSGIFASGTGLMYGLSSSWDNERHLDNAARIYNQAHPDHPVELQLKVALPP